MNEERPLTEEQRKKLERQLEQLHHEEHAIKQEAAPWQELEEILHSLDRAIRAFALSKNCCTEEGQKVMEQLRLIDDHLNSLSAFRSASLGYAPSQDDLHEFRGAKKQALSLVAPFLDEEVRKKEEITRTKIRAKVAQIEGWLHTAEDKEALLRHELGLAEK